MSNVIFKKFETIGNTKDAAIKESGLNLRVDATQAYKKWAKENVTNEDNIKEWMKEYLKKKKFTMPNDGAYIVLQSAVADTRERPYKVEKPKYDARTHSPEKFYVIRDTTGHEVGREKTSKAAEQKAKEFITDFKEDVTINYEWVSKEKNSLYATVKYVPSKGTQPCKLLVFGYIPVD
jgi:hypothetical protein